MKINDRQTRRIAQAVLKGLKNQKVIVFKEKEEVVLKRAEEIVRADFRRENDLDTEVMRMLDDLERQNPGEFQRYKNVSVVEKAVGKRKEDYFVKLSEERVSHLARLVVDGIWNDDLVDYTDDDAAFRAAKKGLNEFMNELDDVDEKVKTKVASLKRGVVEGSPEWDILYGKYFEEEMQRRGQS